MFKIGEEVIVVDTRDREIPNGTHAKVLEIDDRGEGAFLFDSHRYEIKVKYKKCGIGYYYQGDLKSL